MFECKCDCRPYTVKYLYKRWKGWVNFFSFLIVLNLYMSTLMTVLFIQILKWMHKEEKAGWMGGKCHILIFWRHVQYFSSKFIKHTIEIITVINVRHKLDPMLLINLHTLTLTWGSLCELDRPPWSSGALVLNNKTSHNSPPHHRWGTTSTTHTYTVCSSIPTTHVTLNH